MIRRVVVTVAAVFLLTGGSCATASGPQRPPSTVFLHVENHNWNNAVIYAVRSGMRTRLGDVRTNERAVLRVRWSALDHGTMQLFIRFIGSRETFLTPSFSVVPGQHVGLRIENYLNFSTLIPHRTEP